MLALVAGRKQDDFDDLRTDVLPQKTAPRAVGALVRVLDVPAKPSEVRLTSGTCTLGSAEGNDLIVPDRSVSRRHVELTLGREGVQVRDLGSRNGTFYLGQKIGTLTLALGARFTIGAVEIAIDPDTEGLLDGLVFEGDSYRSVLGSSPRMKRLFAVLQRLESSTAPVLLEGESGVGKEVVARAIHEGSPAAEGKFVALNCGAIPKDLVGSELFGHKRGAFTGAIESRKGAFELADKGTLFLDEIAELPVDVQPQLLRALELGEIKPVGGDETRTVKARVIAATHRDLAAEVSAGRFRQDLFYRLAVLRIPIPPLRTRPEDIERLALHFAEGRSLPQPILEELKARAWPGNARELRNAVQAYLALGHLPAPTAGPALDLEAMIRASIDPTLPYADQKETFLEQFSRAYIVALLRYTGGNQAAAARIGKLDRTHLGRMMAKYGLR
jgi:transcriptional regulator with GAF, ATPase, and Fis domain